MKKITLSILAVAILLAPSMSASAQVVSQGTQIETLRAQIEELTIQLLLAQIADLKAQIAAILGNPQPQKAMVESVVPMSAPQEIPAITTVGDATCQGDNLVLPISLKGKWRSALIHVFTSNLRVDMRKTMNSRAAPASTISYDASTEFGSTKDLNPVTSGYANPDDNPYLNGGSFRYEITIYDKDFNSKMKTVVEETSGNIVLPICN